MLPITKLPTPSLRRTSRILSAEELQKPEIQQIIANMIPTMYEANGIGIAAPQVAIDNKLYKKTVNKTLPDKATVLPLQDTPVYGFNIQVCVINKEAIPNKFKVDGEVYSKVRDLVLVNPTFEKISKKTTTEDEGCLSVTGQMGQVKRFKDIHVEALDHTGRTLSFDASGYFARVIQHEVDHLNGVLFVDRAHTLYEHPTS
jgi:peptide deformylase